MVTYDGNLTVKWHKDGSLDSTTTLGSPFPTLNSDTVDGRIAHSPTWGVMIGHTDEIAY